MLIAKTKNLLGSFTRFRHPLYTASCLGLKTSQKSSAHVNTPRSFSESMTADLVGFLQ